MRIILCFFVFLFSHQFLLAQIIDNTNCAVYAKEDFFNQKFIQDNKIKQIYGEVMLKKELKPMERTSLFQQFDFDQQGRLYRSIESVALSKNQIDTSVVLFYYEGDLLAKKVYTDNNGFYAHSYQYDSEGKMIKMTYSREENKFKTRYQFESTKSIIVFFETYEYKDCLPEKCIRTYFNQQGKPYQTLSSYFDGYGQLIEETTQYVVTKKSSSIYYKYDELFRAIEKKDVANFIDKNEIITSYEYDEIGNLLSEKMTRNGVFRTNKEFMYQENMLLKALLNKNEETGTIQVVKYTYQFYE
jgi:YD repeat-containing protein